jgi:hypothetical protein
MPELPHLHGYWQKLHGYRPKQRSYQVQPHTAHKSYIFAAIMKWNLRGSIHLKTVELFPGFQ